MAKYIPINNSSECKWMKYFNPKIQGPELNPTWSYQFKLFIHCLNMYVLTFQGYLKCPYNFLFFDYTHLMIYIDHINVIKYWENFSNI